MKTKMNFSDIAGMLERNEMIEIIGGQAAKLLQKFDDSESGGWTGGKMASFAPNQGGMYGLGVGNSYSNNVSNFGNGTNSKSISNAASSWSITATGARTSNPSDISRFFEYLKGQSNGQNISNFNPSMSDINSFIAGERQFATNGGVITLPNGTVWGGQLNNVDIYKSKDPRSPNYNPYAQWTINTFAGVFQNAGDSISAGAFTLTATGIGASIGIPLAAVGNAISLLGTGIEVGNSIYQTFNGINVAQNTETISKDVTFIIIQSLIEKRLLKGLDVTPNQIEMLKQTLGMEFTLIQRLSNKDSDDSKITKFKNIKQR